MLHHIRLEDKKFPILILSAKGGPDDRNKGFSYDVDEHLAKSCNLEEFLMCIERLMKRSSWSRNGNVSEGLEGEEKKDTYVFGANTIDFRTMTAQGTYVTIHLTDHGVRLLKIFITNQGKTLSRKVLL